MYDLDFCCRQLPHLASCPYAEPEEPIAICPDCKSEVYESEVETGESDGIYCPDCIADSHYCRECGKLIEKGEDYFDFEDEIHKWCMECGIWFLETA